MSRRVSDEASLARRSNNSSAESGSGESASKAGSALASAGASFPEMRSRLWRAVSDLMRPRWRGDQTTAARNRDQGSRLVRQEARWQVPAPVSPKCDPGSGGRFRARGMTQPRSVEFLRFRSVPKMASRWTAVVAEAGWADQHSMALELGVRHQTSARSGGGELERCTSKTFPSHSDRSHGSPLRIFSVENFVKPPTHPIFSQLPDSMSEINLQSLSLFPA